MTYSPVARPRQPGGAVTRRFRRFGLAFPLLGMQITGLVLFLFLIVSIPLIFLTVGIPMAIGCVYLTRMVCNGERAVYRREFGVAIHNPYRPRPKGHLGVQLVALTRDATVWRDFAWQAVNFTLGLSVSVVYLSLLGGALFAVVQPFLYMAWPDVFNNYYGFLPYDTTAEAWMLAVPIATMHLVLWWTVGDIMFAAYAKLAGLLLGSTNSARLERRVVELTTSRAESVDSSAAELRRIERDLHDGAQARMVALGMSLGMAEELIKTDPEAAARLLAEARENSGAALAELRDLVRGIHPPVLADRGLSGAVEALALKHPLPITVIADLPGRPPEPVESAAYFAVAEALTNVAKYAKATEVRVRIGYFGSRLGITIRDNGIGGASIVPGGGLDGLVRRLGAFDGTVAVRSPAGGPTVITLEIPCGLVDGPGAKPS